MTTPPSRVRSPEPSEPASAERKPGGSGLVAARPEAQAVPISADAAVEALSRPSPAPAQTLEQAAPAGRTTSEIQLVGTAVPAAPAVAASGTVLGQRVGVGAAQGQSQGQSLGAGLGAGPAHGAAQAVAEPGRGIGRRDREPAQPEAELGPAIATKPVHSRPTVALFGIRAGQLVAWELAVLAVALVHRERLNILIPVGVGALILIVLTVIRRRGRWLYQWVGLWLRYRTRRRRRRIPGGENAGSDEVARTLLSSVVRGAEIVPIEVDELEAALISHAGGLTAVLEVTPLDSGHVVEPSQALPPLPVLLPTAAIGEPVVTAQIIIQSIPAPNFLGLGDSAAISYHELAAGAVPATRGCWLALQGQHVAEDYTAADLHQSVIHAVERLQRRLRKAGLRARLLNRDEVSTELLRLARVEFSEASAPSGVRRNKKMDSPAVQESWRSWSAGAHVHTSFRMLDWPDLAEPAGQQLLDRLVHTPTLATTVTVAARRRPAVAATDDDVELEAVVRVTLPTAAAVPLATAQITEIVEGAGGRIERLDGEQVFGVAASLPLGGFLS